jgi:antirestriction protein ArdC
MRRSTQPATVPGSPLISPVAWVRVAIAAGAMPRGELVAELGAVLLGDRLEIGSAMANHAAYLGHWGELLKESPRVLLQVLSDAR